ncbi:MAG: PQQ-binding-like beta-propeller repeat protein [Acidimicrobiales bacterium]
MRPRQGAPGTISLTMCACAVAVMVTVLSGSPASEASAGRTASASASGQWPYPNGTLTNTRVATTSTITARNVATLHKAWAFRLSGKAATNVGHYGSLAANPIVEHGVVYVQDLECDVFALDLSTGALLWEHKIGEPERSGPGPNGVAVVGTVVYGLTPTSAFALRAKSGKRIWVDDDLLTKGEGTFGIQPQVATGRVYLASQYGTGPGGGVLMALDASTGARLWKFDTTTGYSPGVKALGLGAGGAWETPLVGTDGSVTYGIGNPYQRAAEAVAHPARQLYTDSDVNLTAATGKLRWYHQGVTDDFLDWDMQTSPISARSHDLPVVIGSGKMGYVYEMNAATGKLVWKTPVGRHDGNDRIGLLALEHKSKLKAPYTTFPGSYGGVLSNLALAGDTVYVATLDLALTAKTMTTVTETSPASAPSGEVEALNLGTGKVEWDTKVPTFPLGAVTVSNDLVFTTLVTGELLALDRSTGAIVYRHELPTSTNAPIAVAGSTLIVPAGDLKSGAKSKNGHPQIVAYRVSGP